MHVLGFVGVSTSEHGPMIVLEYCENGDLLQFLRRTDRNAMVDRYPSALFIQLFQSKRPATENLLLSIAYQICDGMVAKSERAIYWRMLCSGFPKFEEIHPPRLGGTQHPAHCRYDCENLRLRLVSLHRRRTLHGSKQFYAAIQVDGS